MSKFAELMAARDALKQDQDEALAFLEEVLTALEVQQNHHIEDEDKQFLTIDPERVWVRNGATAKIQVALFDGHTPDQLETTVRVERRVRNGEWGVAVGPHSAGSANHGAQAAQLVLVELADMVQDVRGKDQRSL